MYSGILFGTPKAGGSKGVPLVVVKAHCWQFLDTTEEGVARQTLPLVDEGEGMRGKQNTEGEGNKKREGARLHYRPRLTHIHGGYT